MPPIGDDWFEYGRPLDVPAVARGYRERAAPGGDRPTRVLYVDPYPRFGGGQQVLLAIVNHLDRARYEPIVALPSTNPARHRLEDAGVASVGIPFDEANNTLPSPFRPRSVLRMLTSLARAQREVLRVSRRQQIGLIHANSAVAGVHVLPVARWLGIPCVVHAHDFNTAVITNRLLTLLMRYKRSAMVFVSQALANYYQMSRGVNYPYRVIHNGIDTQMFRPQDQARSRIIHELGLPLNCFLIGSVGRIETWKGHKLLIESFALVASKSPRARLVIAGGVITKEMTRVEQDLHDQVKRLGLDDRVTFVAFRDDIPSVMTALDVLVHTPIEPEAFGLVLIEAMACGRPVVTFPTGGIAEIVSDGVSGLLAPVGDSAGIAGAIDRLIQDPALGVRLGEAGRRIVEERFTVERQAGLMQQLYDDVLGRGPARRPSRQTWTDTSIFVGG